MKAQETMSTQGSALAGTAQSLRPASVTGRSAQAISSWLNSRGYATDLVQDSPQLMTGITMDSREVQAGDLYVALPGAKVHGASFATQAIKAGAQGILTDSEGLLQFDASASGIAVLVTEQLRAVVGPLSAEIYESAPRQDAPMTLFAVTGTNGKTTTTYMLNSIMQHLGHTTGLIGTIEILAGGEAIPSKLTTPESPHVHSLVSLMREQGISSMAMEVSSHALDYRRVDGLTYDVAGFTNLTQDHLDLHGSMENYCASKAQLFTPERCRRAVITVDDHWGQKMAQQATQALGKDRVVQLYTAYGRGLETLPEGLAPHDWVLTEVQRSGIGHSFVLLRADGTRIESSTQLPADFNVSNAALATVMAFESGLKSEDLLAQVALPETLTPVVPGRMQLISTDPVAIVDFAHNPDALQRALEALDPAEEEGKVIVVFGATGERDQTKRPIMGVIAGRHADIVIVTDDDPHDEAPAPIRQEVEAGVRTAQQEGARVTKILNLAPRADAIAEAIKLAGPHDSILVAGRGHEVAQEVAGVDLDLDDRVEVARSLHRQGYSVLQAYQTMVEEA